MMRLYEPFSGDDHEPIDRVFELADVARPVVRLQRPQHRTREPGHGASVLGVGGLQEVQGERLDILSALPQRRQMNREHIESVVEVLTKRPSCTICRSCAFVAATTRKSACSSLSEPTGVNRFSCKTRSSFACRSSGISPISSRKIVLGAPS